MLYSFATSGLHEYIHGIQYGNTTGSYDIDFVKTSEGRAIRLADNTYKYQYDLTDHLGNVRVTFDKDPYNGQARRLQEDNYYAYGKRASVAPVSLDNKYLYNGKDIQDELGQYDYGARFYDPEIGRWNVIDPLADEFGSQSPYNYVNGDPVNLIDPTGMAGIGWILPNGGSPYWDPNINSRKEFRRSGIEGLYIGQSAKSFLDGATGDRYDLYKDGTKSDPMVLGIEEVIISPNGPVNSDNKGGDPGFLEANWKDLGFMANDLTQAYIGANTTLRASSGYRLAQTTVQLPLGLATRTSTRALSVISKIGGGVARIAPVVAFAGIGLNMRSNQQVTAGDVYQTLVTGASIVPGWGLIMGGGALAAEGASYYFTGRSVSDNINRQLNGGVIYSWK